MTLLHLEKPNLNNPSKPCHNCRRRRLRCDRSLPGCHKCSSRREECLGYAPLLRWANAVSVRGKLQGQVTHQEEPYNQRCKARNGFLQTTHSESGTSIIAGKSSIRFNLVDPLLQDLDPRHRLYINHFTTSVCQDLVSFDQDDHNNPFRSTITLLGKYDFLREIILATSAVHIATLRRSRGHPRGQELSDALAARGRAYRLLRQALTNLELTSQRAIVMIAVVFFINFDLIDSGKGSWMPHIEAAGNLMTSIQNMNGDIPPFITRLAEIVVADCLTYHILGSALGGVGDAIEAFEAIDITSTLQKAAVYSYHCCPPFVLNLLARACKLSAQDVPEARSLVDQLRAFDVATWVHKVEGLPPNDDLGVRVSVASAHRAAACLYVVLVTPDVSMHLAEHLRPSSLVQEVFGHLASIPIDHALAKGVVWPTFLAGAQADDSVSRQWCLQRMQTMWFSTPWICPWGYFESAIVMLRDVWKAQDLKVRNGTSSGLNWLQELRGLKERCLIV